MRTKDISSGGGKVTGGKTSPFSPAGASPKIEVSNVAIAELVDTLGQFSGTDRAEGFSVSGELQFRFDRRKQQAQQQVDLLSNETSFLFHLFQSEDGPKHEPEDEISGDVMRQAIANYHYQLRRKAAKMA